MLATIAQTTEQAAPTLPVVLFYIGIPVFTLVAVAVACWVFWRAKQREDAQALLDRQQAKEKELSWRNARSS